MIQVWEGDGVNRSITGDCWLIKATTTSALFTSAYVRSVHDDGQVMSYTSFTQNATIYADIACAEEALAKVLRHYANVDRNFKLVPYDGAGTLG